MEHMSETVTEPGTLARIKLALHENLLEKKIRVGKMTFIRDFTFWLRNKEEEQVLAFHFPAPFIEGDFWRRGFNWKTEFCLARHRFIGSLQRDIRSLEVDLQRQREAQWAFQSMMNY